MTVDPRRLKNGIARVDALHEAHVAEIALRHDRLRAVLGDDLAPAAADLGDRLVPGDALELVAAVGARALGADAAQRIHQPVGIVVVVVEVLELHAQGAARDRMLLVALDVDELAVIHLVDPWRRCRDSRAGMRRRRCALGLLVHRVPSARIGVL